MPRFLTSRLLPLGLLIPLVGFLAFRSQGSGLPPAASEVASATSVLTPPTTSAQPNPRLPPDREQALQKALELLEIKLLAQTMAERSRDLLLEQSRVTAAEVRGYYDSHLGDFTPKARFTARALLVYVRGNPAFPERGLDAPAARARAEEALAKLRAGENWETVARTYSDDEGTRERGGLIRDGEFGFFAPELEQAVRSQGLGKPGGVVKSDFGYHLVEVEARSNGLDPEPFAKVEEGIKERLVGERSSQARESFMGPIRAEAGLILTEAGRSEASPLDRNAVAADALLARVGTKEVHEEDLGWFIRDALLPNQRVSALSRPGARQSLLRSYLDMLVLAAKARREGLDRAAAFVEKRRTAEQSLREEFAREK